MSILTRKYRCTKIRINATHESSGKDAQTKTPEEQANFISWRFALLCGCILLALCFLLGRVAWLQIIAPDMLVRQGDMRSLRVGKSPRHVA